MAQLRQHLLTPMLPSMYTTAKDTTATSTFTVSMAITIIAITMRAAKFSIPTDPSIHSTLTIPTTPSTIWDNERLARLAF
ncbi:MAG TPA: hypothetical protein VF792_11400 [Ktedonobacterales bacterium]